MEKFNLPIGIGDTLILDITAHFRIKNGSSVAGIPSFLHDVPSPAYKIF